MRQTNSPSRKRRARRPHSPRRLGLLEQLESRRLLACSISFTSGGEIHIEGSNDHDQAVVRQSYEEIGGNKLLATKVSLTCGSNSKSDTSYEQHSLIRFWGYDRDDYFYNDTSIESVAIGGEGTDKLFGGTSKDILHGSAGQDIIDGREGDDDIYGGPGHDLLGGGAGKDEIFGDDGNDTIYGGEGDDDLYGMKNDDLLLGEGGDDELFGGDGDDGLRGNEGSDDLWGEAGNDSLRGDEGMDVLHGGPDNDILFGGRGFDQLYGDAGNDGLYGGDDFDILQGGSGADRMLVDPYDADSLPDLASIDAKVVFVNGKEEEFKDENAKNGKIVWSAGEWTETEIERVDGALNVIHEAAGDTHLLKRANDMELVLIRRGKADQETVTLAWNDGQSISLPQPVFDPWESYNPWDVDSNGGIVSFFRQVIYHEVGHFWGSTKDFDALSNWQKLSVNDPVPPNYVRAMLGSEPVDWIYHESATFAEDYGKSHPNEDFASAFTALMADASGAPYIGGPGASAIPAKITWLYNHIV